MRSSGAKGDATNSPVENGISHKDEEECEAHRVAAKVVQSVVKRAEREAEQRSPQRCHDLPRLPTIQIDTVPSPPWSPVELSGDEQEEPIDEEHIDLQIEEQTPETPLSDELRESLRSYVEDILSQAMGVVEKKLKFFGIDDDDDDEDEEEAAPPPPPPEDDEEEEEDDEESRRMKEEEEREIRAAAEKVVEEVISMATETVTERMEKEEELPYPDLPSFQIDTVVSAPPSPEQTPEEKVPDGGQKKKWSFRMQEEEDCVKEDKGVQLLSFDEAPEDMKEVASNFVKDIVGRAITIAEEKSVPTVPFNFEDVDLMRTSGPWYVRVREALLRVLRSACFCTPRPRNDS